MTGSPIAQFGYWPPNKRRTLGIHKNNGLEIILVVRGELTWQVEGVVETVSPGSVFFTLPWEAHGSVRHQEPGCELYFVTLRLDRRYGRGSNRFGFHRALGLPPLVTQRVRHALLLASRRSHTPTARMSIVMPQLIEELSRHDSSAAACSALARLVLIELHRSLSQHPQPRPRPEAIERVKRFMQRLADECQRPWSLASMGDACNLGRSRFAEILRQLTGDTPTMALNRARVDRAKRLLGTSPLPITRIALDCGFSSSQYFAGVFRAYTGQAARDYRRSARA